MVFRQKLYQHLHHFMSNTCQNYSISREARALSKLIRKGETNRLRKSQIPLPTILSEYAAHALYAKESRRMTVMNKVFMGHICDFLSFGKYAEEMNNYGIQIIEVKLTRNMHVVFVYWIHTKPIDEAKVNNYLKSVASNLRYDLNSLKQIGCVPEIRFAKHENFIKMQEIENVIDCMNQFHTVQEDDEAGSITENIEPKNIPEMRHDVLGLDHLRIVNDILSAKKKTKRMPVERARKPVSSEDIKFDKKNLAKIIFKERHDLLKQKKLSSKFFNEINFERTGSEEDIDEHHNSDEYKYEDQEIIDECDKGK